MYQVMIVADEPNILESLANYIRQANLNFLVIAKALGAEDALFHLGMTKLDLVIIDFKMPITDGLSLLQQIRQAGWNGYTAIMTGRDDFAYARQAIRFNVFEYVLKPVSPEDITALLIRAKENLNCRQTGIAKLYDENGVKPEDQALPDEADGSLPFFIRQAKDYIKNHYDEALTLIQVAKNVAVNPVYLSACFAKYCGRNFLEYVTNYRLIKAKELLENTNLQIQEVALQVGYTDIAYFSRIFRRVTGLTPSNYRSHYRKKL